MRVVAGEARGRRLVAPEGSGTRPTLDRVREAMFNALGSLAVIDDAEVLDLFAGSGALGIEALSRGARRAVFVERDGTARRTIARNLEVTGLADRAEIRASDALDELRRLAVGGVTVDLVLLDPPWETADGSWRSLLDAVAPVVPDGIVVIESDRSIEMPPGWDSRSERRYGGTLVRICQPPRIASVDH